MVKTKQHFVVNGVLRTALNKYIAWGSQMGWEVGSVFGESNPQTVSVVWVEANLDSKPTGLPTWNEYMSR